MGAVVVVAVFRIAKVEDKVVIDEADGGGADGAEEIAIEAGPL